MTEVETLLGQIKDCWPKFVITKENLLRPTPEVVFQFYSNVINDHNETLEQLTGVSANFDFNCADYEPEEQLFLKISRLLGKICGLKFTLADIYQPTAIRTKNFFKVCIHLVAFTEYMQNEAETLGNEVFKTKEDTTKLLLQQQELIDETNEYAKNKAELNENKNLLEQQLKSTRSTYREMKALKASKEKLYAEKRNRIENIKRELQNEEYELKRLENVEKDLLEQRITEREHQNILNTIEALKSESEILDNDNIDMGDGLEHEHEVLQHSADCLRILNKCDFNVESVKKLIHKEDELKVISNTVDTLSIKLNLTKQQKFEIEQNLAALKDKLIHLQSELKTVKENYTSSITLFAREFSELKEGLQDKYTRNCKTILDYKGDIEKLEENLDKMKKAFTTEYIKVSKVEKTVVDKFKDMLMKYKEIE